MADRQIELDASKVVHVIESDAATRTSTSILLRRHGYGVETWSGAAAFLAGTRLRTNECVILDIDADGVDAAELQQALAGRSANLPVIMTGARPDIATVIRVMKDGAIDFLLKPYPDAGLLAAVGEAFRRIARERGRAEPASIAERKLRLLSARERQVLRGLTDGMSNKEIALALNISPRTVEIHRANLMAKLDAHNLSSALRIAFTANLTQSAFRWELQGS